MIPSEPACQLRAMRESDGLVRVVTRNLTISA